MEDKNLLLEELPGASPDVHLAARGHLISAGWAVWTLRDDKPFIYEIRESREEANQWINCRIAFLQDEGLVVPRFHFGEIFLKG